MRQAMLTVVLQIFLIVFLALSSLIGVAILALLALALARVLAKTFAGKGGKKRFGLWKYHDSSVFKLQAALKSRLKNDYQDTNAGKQEGEEKPVAVISFDGDLRASGRKLFAQSLDEVIVNKALVSELIVSVNSPGGLVSEYGAMFAEMERARAACIPLTVCIDVCAASGGYLMSLPANKIVAAPFSTVGSVGVVASIPSFNKWLKQHSIQPRQYTAGNYKRTVTLTEEDSEEGERHFQSQLEAIHRQFLAAVEKYRPNAKLEAIRTGDHWSAQESITLGLGLIDEMGTSQEYLLKVNGSRDLVQISQKPKLSRGLISNLFSAAARSFVDSFALARF